MRQGFLLYHHAPVFYRQGVSLELKLARIDRNHWQSSFLRFRSSQGLQTYMTIPNFHMGTGDSNSESRTKRPIIFGVFLFGYSLVLCFLSIDVSFYFTFSILIFVCLFDFWCIGCWGFCCYCCSFALFQSLIIFIYSSLIYYI